MIIDKNGHTISEYVESPEHEQLVNIRKALRTLVDDTYYDIGRLEDNIGRTCANLQQSLQKDEFLESFNNELSKLKGIMEELEHFDDRFHKLERYFNTTHTWIRVSAK